MVVDFSGIVCPGRALFGLSHGLVSFLVDRKGTNMALSLTDWLGMMTEVAGNVPDCLQSKMGSLRIFRLVFYDSFSEKMALGANMSCFKN